MDFKETFQHSVHIGLQMEAMWFYEKSSEDQLILRQRHAMPFLRANFGFERDLHKNIKDIRKKTIKWVPRTDRMKKTRKEQKRQARLMRETAKVNLLSSLFRHIKPRTTYNEAFRLTPRRATRQAAFEDLQGRVILGGDNKNNNNNDSTAPKTTSDLDTDKGTGNTVSVSEPGSLLGNLDDEKGEQRDLGSFRSFPDRSMMLVNRKRPASALSTTDQEGVTTVIVPRKEVIFSFLYIDEDGSILIQRDQTGLPGCRRCPFCFFQGDTDEELLLHCKKSHGERLNFRARISEDRTLHIAVWKKKVEEKPPYPNHLNDFVFIRCPKWKGNVELAKIRHVERSPANVAALDRKTRLERIRLLGETGAEQAVINQFKPSSSVPIRQYFHSRTNEPMMQGEWDVDSDEESDSAWHNRMSEELIDEFTDVTDPEKRLVKMWNKFVKSHTVTSDRSMPGKCLLFIRSHIKLLVEYNLRQELYLHFSGLWNHGLISQNHFRDCMQEYDKLAAK